MKKIALFFMIFMIFSILSAAVPGKIPVQGTLMDKDGNLISDDAAEITFIIYDAETDGNELWTEERTLFVEKGKLAVYLGEIEPVTYEKIGGQEELWLSVTYDGEEMSRIQLGSVPFAHEAQMAHNAEAVGKYTETTLDEYFNSACAEGSYLRGWSGTAPICETDEGGESGGTTYTAGAGIIINGEEISIDQSIDLYIAGTGIDIDAGTNTISVNPSVYATIDHNHDGRYYLRSEIYTKTESDGRFYNYESGSQTDNNLAAFNGGALKNSPISATTEGNVEITGSLDVNGTVESNSITATSADISGNTKTNTLQVSNSIQVYDSTGSIGWKRPIRIKRYNSLGNDISYDTNFNTSEWCAAIVGFNAANMDIEEADSGDNKVYMYKSSGTWHIRANFMSDSGDNEDWMVKVMFMRKEISDCDDDS